MNIKTWLLAAAALCVAYTPAAAQTRTQYTAPDGVNGVNVTASNGLPVNIVSGSVSASFAGFTPTAGAVANLAVTTTSGDVALPAGTSLVVTNTGAADVAFRIQVGVGTALTTDLLLKAGAAVGLAPGTATHISAITASGTSTLNIQGGVGGAAGYGGGGSGGGGGGAVTAASGSYASGALAAGAIVDLGTGVSPAANTLNARLATINTTLGSPFQAGASIGNTSFAATQSGAWNITNITGAVTLPTGAASSANQASVIGTNAPGTAAASSLLTGGVYTAAGITLTTGQQAALQFDSTGHLLTTASVGGLGQGSTTSGQTGVLNMGAVTTAAPTYTTAQTQPLSLDTTGNLRVYDPTLYSAITAAIPSGTNVIGKVGIDQTTPGTTNAVSFTNTTLATTTVDGGSVTLGSKADAATCATTNTLLACERQLHTDLTGSIPAGAALIGKVGIDQTTPGTTNAVSATNFPSAVATGTGAQGATVPRFTVATDTATVAGSASLPAGTNVVGVTGVAQASTTSGQSGPLNQAAVLTANPAYTTAQTSPLTQNITGALRTINAPGTMETCSSGNVANATTACTLATAVGHTTFITGLHMTSAGATAALAVSCTITGVVTGTQTFTFVHPVLTTLAQRDIYFNPPIPASAANTTIVVSCPAGGSGAANAAMNAEGFQQ